MDYSYINQLLDRYWTGATSLEEEEILRAFFSQEELPAELATYKLLFAYQHEEAVSKTLGEDFDKKVMAIINEEREEAEPKVGAQSEGMPLSSGKEMPQQTRIVSLTERLKPLFKAAAIVAIVLTLGNAIQVPFNNNNTYTIGNVETVKQTQSTAEVVADSARLDSMQRSSIEQVSVQPSPNILK